MDVARAILPATRAGSAGARPALFWTLATGSVEGPGQLNVGSEGVAGSGREWEVAREPLGLHSAVRGAVTTGGTQRFQGMELPRRATSTVGVRRLHSNSETATGRFIDVLMSIAERMTSIWR